MVAVFELECGICVGSGMLCKLACSSKNKYVGLARIVYKRCIFSIFGREIAKYTVIYGVYVRFWSALQIWPPLMVSCPRSTGRV